MSRKSFDGDRLAPLAPEEDPTECPLCGAPVWTKLYDRKDVRGLQIRFDCESSALIMGGRIWAPSYDGQSYACAHIEKQRNELRRLRISQLRRMADVAMYGTCGSIRDLDRWRRFADACLAEIERLRGEG